MISQKQLDANRANAQKSTGPRTEAGKQRSCLNATRHGLTGQVVILPQEDLAAFNLFIASIIATFAPADALERQLAQSYANYQWRINRAAAIEDNLFALGIMEQIAGNLAIDNPEAFSAASNAKTFRADSAEFSRLALYTQRLMNQSERVLRQLNQLQSDRKQREAGEMTEAVAAYTVHKEQGAPFDPKENGFVLTLARIEAHIHRNKLTDSAYVAEFARRKAA